MKKEFNKIQQNEDPARHRITGDSYKKAVSDRPKSLDRTERIERVKKVEKEYNEKNTKLGDIRRRELGNNRPAPGLHPPSLGGGANSRPRDPGRVARNRDRLEKVQKQLDEKYKTLSNNAEKKGRAKDAFSKGKNKDVAKNDFDKAK